MLAYVGGSGCDVRHTMRISNPTKVARRSPTPSAMKWTRRSEGHLALPSASRDSLIDEVIEGLARESPRRHQWGLRIGKSSLARAVMKPKNALPISLLTR
jgi:hypothetical protein